VTGASRGLGLLLARHSCPLVICARRRRTGTGGRPAARAGAEVTAVACDVTDEASPRLLVDTALERYGRLDILISNAGIIQVGPVQAGQVGLYETALNTMALAQVRLALTALPAMRRQGHGRIVTIASVGGKLSVPHLQPYSNAKFAAVGFSEGLRAELGRGSVTVTTIVPGLMRTALTCRPASPGRPARSSPGSRSAPACRSSRWTPSGAPARSSARYGSAGPKSS
jgi:NAD(P)-dependent dehydrogenase (short-subunit alcohol dehydrogenase family)